MESAPGSPPSVAGAEAPVATIFATGRGQKAIHTTDCSGFSDKYARDAKGSITGAFMQVLADGRMPATLGQVAEAVEAGVRHVVGRWQAPEAVGKELTQDWPAALGGRKAALILMVGQYQSSFPSLQPAIGEDFCTDGLSATYLRLHKAGSSDVYP